MFLVFERGYREQGCQNHVLRAVDNRTEANTKVFGQGTQSSSARTKSSDTRTGRSYVHLQSSGRNAESSSARTEPSDTGNKVMPSGRVFSSRLGTTGAAEFRLEIRQGFGLVSSGGRPIWTSPNLRSRVSELHPDMPRVSTRKSRDCFLVWDLSHEADLTMAR